MEEELSTWALNEICRRFQLSLKRHIDLKVRVWTTFTSLLDQEAQVKLDRRRRRLWNLAEQGLLFSLYKELQRRNRRSWNPETDLRQLSGICHQVGARLEQ